MNANPAFHPHYPELISGATFDVANGGAMSTYGVRPVIKSVPCSPAYDRYEARTYAGLLAVDLVEHAKDIEAMQQEQPLRIGSSARFIARTVELTNSVLQKALRAYLTVKAAMRLMARPLQDRVRRTTPGSTTPIVPKVWVTKAPTKSEWDARDTAAGYDIRGTSPTWIMRRAYAHRTRRRLELEPPLERAYRLGQNAQTHLSTTVDFIGPPKPLHYKEVEDLYQVWPPVELPKVPKGMLPYFRNDEASVIPCETIVKTRNTETTETLMPLPGVTHINELIEGYNYALEQFGKDDTRNYLQGLMHEDERLMNWIINYHSQEERALTPNNKEPPDVTKSRTHRGF